MQNHLSVLLTAVAILQALSSPAAADQDGGPDAAVMATFVANVKKYVQLRNGLEAEVGKLAPTDDQGKITARQNAVAAKVAAARAGARPGDIFTSEAVPVFRSLVAADFKRRTPQGKKVMLDEVPTFCTRVNMIYPSELPLATFPATLLKTFPELPPETEFRFVARHLVLRDIAANLIVDFILNVMP